MSDQVGYQIVDRSRPKALFTIQVDVGTDTPQSLQIFEDTDPQVAALHFCQKHNLSEEAVNVIVDTIFNNYRQMKTKQYRFLDQGLIADESRSDAGYSMHTQRYQNIFDKLHQEALVKQQRKNLTQAKHLQQELKENKTQPRLNYNSGEYLYQKGISHKENTLRKIESEKSKQNEMITSLPFKPFISEKSQQLALSRKPNRTQAPEDYLIAKGRQLEEKREALRNQIQQQEIQNLPFRPVINPMYQQSFRISSEKIMEQKKQGNHNSSTIHEKLYQESFHLQSRRNQLQNNSEQHLVHSVSSSHRPGDVPFLERMAISINERQQRQHFGTSIEESRIDIETGQPLFKPQINKTCVIQRNTDCLPIGDYLYQQRQTKEIRQSERVLEQMAEINALRAKSSDKSNAIFEHMKKRALEEIFTMMDSDSDGFISAHHIEISGFSCDVLEILAPLLFEMEQINAQLNLTQFIDSANRLIQTLSIGDRDRLLAGFKRRTQKEQEQFSFKPNLNKRSKQIASNRPLSADRRKEVKPEQVSYEQRILKECTFKPILYKPLRLYEFTKKRETTRIATTAHSISQRE